MKYSTYRLFGRSVIGTAFAFSSVVGATTNTFLCQVEHSVGFTYQQQEKSWHASAGDEVKVAYQITANDTGANLEKFPYQWIKVADKSFMGFCSDFDLDAQMSCKGLGKLEFHKDTKRFLFVSDKGYVSYNSPRPKYYIGDSESPLPRMEIGTCKQVQQ